MNILIIEDNDYKLEDAIRVLKENGITNHVHVNNYLEAINICFRKKRLSEFDFIILDIQFYEYRPFSERNFPDQHAGYKFLYQLALTNSTIPVFVFSSVQDYLREYNDFLFPSFSEYSKSFNHNSQAFIFTRVSTIREKYEEYMKKNRHILESTNFVIGHAHNKYELRNLIKTHLDSNNQNSSKEQA